jgi:DNA repair protein RecO (recombination protein O)
MDWTEPAIVLHVKPHGETSAVAEVFARGQGRHLGLVHGGRSRKRRPALQPGNLLAAHWRARLSDQLGVFTIEMADPFAAVALDDSLALAGIATLTGLARLLPERDPHPQLYDLALLLLGHLGEPELWPQLLARWELQLLVELGVGLDLETCAATGVAEGLKRRTATDAAPGDIIDALTLTGFFLDQHVLGPRNLRFPGGRTQLLETLRKQAAN